MSDDSTRPIIIKRKKVVAGGAHGGAWKIAYADFVTAMMAFFLLMWLLGSTAKGDLAGIADHFQNPLKVSSQGGSGSGDATSVLQGGGQDLTRQAGQVKRGDVEAKKSTSFSKEAQAEFRRKEQEKLESLKADIEKMIEQSPQLAQFKKQMLLDITSEGLRIQIIDEQNRPMFDSSSADLKPYTRDILRQIGKALNGVQNRISLAGHTDASRFSGGEKGFSNWELSANRANASRRELVVGGMDDSKILRVVGSASTILFDKNDPLNSVNRRISIIVLNRKTEMAILQEEGPESEDGGEVSLPEGLKLPVSGKGTSG
jgi:chemotaxis protein MotB